MRHHDPRFPARTKRGAICALWLAVLLPFAAAAQSNPIVVENQLPGSSGWDIEWGGAGNDIAGQVKGYAGATSVNKGESINLHISVSPAQSYTIDVFRMGWYGGQGGRLMQHIGPLNGTPQATCPVNPTTGLIECAWPVSYTLNTQATSAMCPAAYSSAGRTSRTTVPMSRRSRRVSRSISSQSSVPR